MSRSLWELVKWRKIFTVKDREKMTSWSQGAAGSFCSLSPFAAILSLGHRWVPLWPPHPLSRDAFHKCDSVGEMRMRSLSTKTARQEQQQLVWGWRSMTALTCGPTQEPKGNLFPRARAAAMHRQESEGLGKLPWQQWDFRSSAHERWQEGKRKDRDCWYRYGLSLRLAPVYMLS